MTTMLGLISVILGGTGKGCCHTSSKWVLLQSKLFVPCLIVFQSETYTPIYSADIAREYSINYNPAVHGRTGPVQVSYPKYFYPQSSKHFPSH